MRRAARAAATVFLFAAAAHAECPEPRFVLTGLVTDAETREPLPRALATVAVKRFPLDELPGEFNDSWAWGTAHFYTDTDGRFEGELERDMLHKIALTDEPGCAGTPQRIDFGVGRAGYEGWWMSVYPSEYAVERRSGVAVINLGAVALHKEPPEPQ